MAGKPILEPMNVISNHSKLRTTLRFADTQFTAGDVVSGKMEMECKAEKGLAIGVVKVELFGVEELTSRDHSATQTFLHMERVFQGPGLPPSNSVHPYPPAEEAVLPHHYYYARRGTTTFLFRLPLPSSSPSSINFGSGLAQIKYEVRATVEVIWKGQRQIVTDRRKVDVIESFEGSPAQPSEGIVVSENGKLWVQGKLLGGVVVPGQPACIELTVKNHSAKKNSNLAVSLTRELVLPAFASMQKPPLQLSDTLASVTFRGPEYIIQPGVEGVAHLVFDVPQTARSVRGGRRPTAEDDTTASIPALFEVQCCAMVKLVMGVGSKDIQLSLPARICHPDTIPEDVFVDPHMDSYNDYVVPAIGEGYSPPFSPIPYASPSSPTPYVTSASPLPYLPPVSPPNAYVATHISPTMSPLPYVDQGHVWIPPPAAGSLYNPYSTPLQQIQQYQYMSMAPDATPVYPVRPSSAQPIPSSPFYRANGLSPSLAPHSMVPLTWMASEQTPGRTPERGEGKGEKAARISHHLRLSSRHRSVSPPAHRYALPGAETDGASAGDLLAASLHQGQKLSPPETHQATRSPDLEHQRSPKRSPAASEVASPRPGFSPRHSFSVDPVTHATLAKSDCIEALEHIAAVTNDVNADMSGSVPDLSPNLDKTLPQPPVPSSRHKPSRAVARPRADDIFLSDENDPDMTPPTPTLAAVMSPPKALRSTQGLNGLDALEARLIAEVGTRKVESNNKKPHVKSIMPISIPRPTDVIDLPVDSAISSLSLPSLGANEGTLRLSAGSRPNSPGRAEGPSPSRDTIEKSKSKEDPPRKHRTEDPKEREHHHLRKMAQGRVTAWLGSIDPDAPPQSATPPVITPPTTNVTLPDQSTIPNTANFTPTRVSATTEKGLGNDAALSTPPNPRSSGFMPIGTLKGTRPTSSPGASPASKDDKAARHGLPRGVVFPPRPLDPEVRYDVRSARGGRGGQVTAVAAIWASATQSPNSQPSSSSERATPRPTGNAGKAIVAHGRITPKDKLVGKQVKTPPIAAPPPVEVAKNRARVIKATSVPAVISSSLATPVLSSTASLARPVRLGARTSLEKTAMETETPSVTPHIAAPKTELAFGQARLRELIKKYQG